MTPLPLPLYYVSAEPTTRNRGTALIRIIMVIPQYFILAFVGIAAFFVSIVGWIGALITGELPTFASDFLAGVVRWHARVYGYFYFLTDEYPPFSLGQEPQYAIQVAIPPTTQLNRLAVLFRIILVIPGAIVASVVGSGIGVVSIASWFMIVFTGAMPKPIYEAVRVGIRFNVRVLGYFWMLTPEYSWGVLGDLPEGTATPAALPSGTEGSAAEVDSSGWFLRLSSEGRTAMIVTLVIGAVIFIVQLANQ